ncbi:MAG: hypothetical protein FWC13_00720 [Oscillospiraceae bacterium]|nr:hypothetical protein [Oscillospiraceae bacterium]
MNNSGGTIGKFEIKRYKLHIAIFVLLAVLLVVYCTLSLVMSDAIGVPRFMQCTHTRPQGVVYDHLLYNFDVDGEVLWANSDSAYVIITSENITFERYRYATLFISRLSDPGSDILITTNEADSDFQNGSSKSFNLFDGQNTVRLPAGGIDEVQIRLGTRQHMSMIIEEITFSRFPVLPDYFATIFAVLALSLGVAWYFIVFRGLGKWLLSHPWILLAILLFFQSLVMVYFISQKRGLHIDEMITISQASSFLAEENIRWFSRHPDFFDTWNSPEYFRNAVTVQEEQFDFLSLFSWARAHHSFPFHHINYLFAASFFPDTFSVWIGGGINIFWIILTSIFLYKASLLLIKDPLLSLLPVIVWGFSNAAMTLAVFIRFYNPSTFFFTLTTHLGLLLITKKAKVDLKFCIALGLTFLLGWLSNSQFVLFFGLAAASLSLWLLFNKEFKQLINSVITLIISIGLHYFFFNFNFGGILTGGRLQNVVALAERLEGEVSHFGIEGHLERINAFLSNLNQSFFGGNVIPVIVLFGLLLVSLVIVFILRRENLSSLLSSFKQHNVYAFIYMFISVAIYFIVVARLARMFTLPIHNRYMILLYPSLTVLITLSFYLVASYLNKRFMPVVLVLVSIVIVLGNIANREVHFLYPNRPDTAAILSTEENRDTLIVIGDVAGMFAVPHSNVIQWEMYDFTHFDRTFISSQIPADFNHEHLNSALDDISPGEGLYLAIFRASDTTPIINHIQQSIGFDHAMLLYRIDAYYGWHTLNMYRIVW